MNYSEITLFSVTKISDIIPYFDRLVESVKDFPYELEHGAYESQENLNRGYNYGIKITSDNNTKMFKGKFQKEYQLFLEKIMPLLNKDGFLSLAYKPTQPIVSERALQEKSKINHIVFLKFAESCSDKSINEVFFKLEELFPKVEGITDFCYGKRLNSLNVDREYIFEMKFLDVAARDKYLTQKEHVEIGNFIISLQKNGEDSVIAFDYKRFPKRVAQNNLPAQGLLFSCPRDSAIKDANVINSENISYKN